MKLSSRSVGRWVTNITTGKKGRIKTYDNAESIAWVVYDFSPAAMNWRCNNSYACEYRELDMFQKKKK